MRRLVLVLTIVAATCIGVVAPAVVAQQRPTWPERFERVRYRSHTWQRDEFSVFENQLTVHAAAVHFGASEGYMICVVNRETGGTWNEKAENDESTAAGLFQFVKGTWDAVLQRYRATVDRAKLAVKAGVSRLNARAASLVAAWLIGNGQTFHWGPC